MGNPVFRFTLSHANLGTQVISEPDGWKEAKLKMERHPEFHSLVEYFEGSFIFYGENNVDNGGADFIKQCENLYGLDAEITILIEADIDGDGVYEETVFNGQLDLTQLKEVQDNKIQVPIIRNDLWAKFITRKETPVNLRSTTDLDGNAVSVPESVDINLISQKVEKKFDGYLLETRTFDETELTTNDYIQLDVEVYTLDEIETKYTLPITTNTEIPASVIDVEEEGSYEFDLRVEVSIVHYDTAGTYPDCSIERTVTGSASYLNLYIQINDETAVQFTEESTPLIFENIATIYTYTGTRSLRKGDQIKIYGDIVGNISDLGNAGATLWIHSFNGIGSVLVPTPVADNVGEACTYLPATEPSNLSIAAPSGEEFPTRFQITAQTTYPNTTAQAFLIHDAMYAILQRITDPTNGGYSAYLGSTSTTTRQYAANGCAWKNICLPGLQVRGYTFDEKQFSLSFDKWWKGASPIFNLGLGYEDVNGTEMIRVENRSRFYDATGISAYFDNVREISRVYDQAMLYNRIEVGYNKWQSEDISGIDDPQTKRVWATILKKADQALQIISQWITASVAIEVTRRKTTEKSEDWRYDDDVFMIAVSDTVVSPDRFVPELNENFTSVSGLKNSDLRYNMIHTPLRMLLRWGAWWNSCLQKYQSSELKFVSGEGNYDMTSDHSCTEDACLAVICDSISEKADIDLSTYGDDFGFLHLPLLYTIEIIDFTWDDYLLIRNNRHKAIGISQTLDNFKRFFIKELTYDICKGKCRIVAWPFDEMPISIIETVMPDRSENEPDEECPTYYIAEFTATLENWTSEGSEEIPGATLESLSGWDNAGINLRAWALSATPDVTINGNGDVSDYIRGEIDTVVGLTYSFDWSLDIVGTGSLSTYFKFMLLDANNNILDSEVSATYNTHGTKTGTVTLSPSGSNGVYFAIQVINDTAISSKSYEINSASLSGGTGASSVPLPSWAWSPDYSGSAKATISYEGYGVKNFVLDNVTVPQEAHTIEVGYVVPTNNTDLSIRFRILNSSGVELYDRIIATEIGDGNQKTATFDILLASIWSAAHKFEISVFDMSTPENFEAGDEVYITKVEISICGEYASGLDSDYQAVLDYATGQGYTLPSATQQILQNQLVLDLKAGGVWDDLDLLYIFATDGDSDFARINWIDPGNFSAQDGASGPTFTTNEGFAGNETNQYMTTGWDPATDGVNFTLNDASAFAHSNTNSGTAGTRFLFGSRNASNQGRIELIPKNISSQHVGAINSAGTTPGLGSAPVSAEGFFQVRRTASNDLRLYKDGTQVGATHTTAATDALNNDDVAILASNGNGTIGGFSGEQITIFGLGSSLQGKESALYTAWNTYFTSI